MYRRSGCVLDGDSLDQLRAFIAAADDRIGSGESSIQTYAVICFATFSIA
jgi:hypothetical protein